MENLAKIQAALAALLDAENERGFVIFEEKHTKKFVQFAGSIREELLLDLPSQTLDVAEDQRATTYFQGLGVRAEEYDVYDAPGGKVVGRQRTFQKSFGRDVEAAAKTAMEVFEKVYQFPPDFELVVIRN